MRYAATATIRASAALAALAAAGAASAQGSILRITGTGTVTGRDINGMTIPLGSGPFTVDFDTSFLDIQPAPKTGQDEFSSAFSGFTIHAPAEGFPRQGGTTQNFLTMAREGEPNADFFNAGVFDCVSTLCGFPVGSIGNDEPIGFESMFLFALFPDGALGTEPFATLGDALQFLANMDLAIATDTFFNANYVPASLLPIIDDDGQPITTREAVLFVSVDGALSDIEFLTATPPCPADLTGDSATDGADLGFLLGAWGPCPACPADLNGDGVVDGADLGLLLGDWGACP